MRGNQQTSTPKVATTRKTPPVNFREITRFAPETKRAVLVCNPVGDLVYTKYSGRTFRVPELGK